MKIGTNPTLIFPDPEVFILESLDELNEEYCQYEGWMLSEALRLAGKSPAYYYLRHVDELKPLAELFNSSQCGYLHVSSHGSKDAIAIGGEGLSYDDFFRPFRGRLKGKRLFMSACSLGNDDFMDAAARANPGIVSVIAPCHDIDFDIAAAFWTAFYTICFKASDHEMLDQDVIDEKLGSLCLNFDISLDYASNDGSRALGHRIICGRQDDGDAGEDFIWEFLLD